MTKPPAMPELPDGATVLPDGSAFAIVSFPLPASHWLYAPREYRDGEEDPIELPSPILSHQVHGDIVRAAIRYAVRSATMCGKESDFDPDALVQNAMYALCGPFGGAALQSAQPEEVSDEQCKALTALFKDAMDWGRSYGQRANLSSLTVDDVSEAYSEKARAILALRPAQQATPEPSRRPLFAASVAARKWAELQEQGHRMQSLQFDGGPGGAGSIDPWGKVMWATPEPVGDVRCEGCGYMTHHREHMGCVRAAKQHTHPAPSVPEAYAKAMDALLDFAQTVGGSSSFWDDVWPEHEAAMIATAAQQGAEHE